MHAFNDAVSYFSTDDVLLVVTPSFTSPCYL